MRYIEGAPNHVCVCALACGGLGSSFRVRHKGDGLGLRVIRRSIGNKRRKGSQREQMA